MDDLCVHVGEMVWVTKSFRGKKNSKERKKKQKALLNLTGVDLQDFLGFIIILSS